MKMYLFTVDFYRVAQEALTLLDAYNIVKKQHASAKKITLVGMETCQTCEA